MSLLQSVMEMFERETGLHMNFDDFSGYVGMHCDVPPMTLDWNHQSHCSSFCETAKKLGARDCRRNKAAANRRAIAKGGGLEGFCHLGLLDLAELFTFRGHILGIFYFGSVVVRGTEEEARRKITRYCELRRRDPAELLEALNGAPVVERSAIPRYREALLTVVDLARYFCESAGIQPEVYKHRLLRHPTVDPEQPPSVVKEAIQYINLHIAEPFIVKDLAAHLGCHPDFLSRKFKQFSGLELGLYLLHARIDRARRLMENPKMDIGTIAEKSGFSNRVHFSKVFRRLTGATPGQLQKQLAAESLDREPRMEW